MQTSIRVIICDECPTIRYGLQHILSSDPTIKMVLSTASTEEILNHKLDLKIDVILLDLKEINPTELQSLRRLKEKWPNIKIIIFTDCKNKSMIIPAIEVGIQGFQLKKAEASDIIDSIHTVYHGGKSMAPCVTNALLEHPLEQTTRSHNCLSKREQEVLNLISLGKTNIDIADKLFISTRTVKFHVSSIFAKLHVKNRTEAASRFRSLGDSNTSNENISGSLVMEVN